MTLLNSPASILTGSSAGSLPEIYASECGNELQMTDLKGKSHSNDITANTKGNIYSEMCGFQVI
jgi:hypothetical protein